MMIIIKQALLNFRRNKWHDSMIAALFFCLIFLFCFLLQLYKVADYSLSEMQKQTATVVTVEPSFKEEQVENLTAEDLQTIKALPYVKEINMIGYTSLEIDGLQTSEKITKTEGAIVSDTDLFETSEFPTMGVTILSDEALKKYFSQNWSIKGGLPSEVKTCLVTKQFAEENQLKLFDELSVGETNQRQKLKIVGIANPKKNSAIQAFYSSIFINPITNQSLNVPQDNNFSTISIQLTSSKKLRALKKELHKISSFNHYRVYKDQSFVQVYEVFLNQKEMLLNGVIASGILNLFLLSLFYYYFFKKRQSDLFSLHLMGLRQSYLILSNILEIVLIVIICWLSACILTNLLTIEVTKDWFSRLQQTTRDYLPLLSLKQPIFNSAVVQQLFVGSLIILVPYLIGFMVITSALTGRLSYIYSSYSYQSRRLMKS